MIIILKNSNKYVYSVKSQNNDKNDEPSSTKNFTEMNLRLAKFSSRNNTNNGVMKLFLPDFPVVVCHIFDTSQKTRTTETRTLALCIQNHADGHAKTHLSRVYADPRRKNHSHSSSTRNVYI